MKKISYILTAFLVVILTSCGGYDQSKVDELEKKISDDKELSESDYRTMVEQLNYILDDIDNAKDLEKWEKENSEEVEDFMGLSFALSISRESDSNFPKDLNKDVDEIEKRLKKMQNEVMKKSGVEAVEVSEEDFSY